MKVTKGLAWTGFRVIADDKLYEQVRQSVTQHTAHHLFFLIGEGGSCQQLDRQ